MAAVGGWWTAESDFETTHPQEESLVFIWRYSIATVHQGMLVLEVLLQHVKDENLKLTLPFGIGMHHAGLSSNERAIVEQLFLEKKIQVLIATATLAWGINMPAHLVIVKGTEYFDGKTSKYVDYPVTVLANHVNAEINAGTITSKQGIMEYIAGTYLYRRLFANPK
ncbi:hypothetical protein TELCIR_05671 [Teladorsagia circumcincta]|uniref:Helicase C-terminal domain-containing protein n=1 Tax=Teladorsagia circumcincta TaxID=45464 RepID=A0A2G9UQH4_TELCI|nr:hypothetical protein TELCIR_05671 [Teladorsagia circumcincta]